jgi:hypothetical protein
VPPGKEGKIELIVDHTDGYSGEIAKSATVTTNDPANQSMVLTLRARFKLEPKPGQPEAVAPIKMKGGPLLVEPSPRWITSAIVGSSSASTLSLYNPDEHPVHIKEIQLKGTDFTARLQTIQDGKRYQVVIATNPALKPGTYRQVVKVVTDKAGDPVTDIQVEATVFPRVFATPNIIVMPTLPHDAPDLKEINWPMVYVRKIREGGLKIKSFTTDIPFLKLDLVTEREGEVYAIRLSLDQSKIKAGGFQGKIHVETNDAETPVLDIPVRGTFN